MNYKLTEKGKELIKRMQEGMTDEEIEFQANLIIRIIEEQYQPTESERDKFQSITRKGAKYAGIEVTK
jgi:predicted transcriptional regulator